jgi:hypothetical protein
MEMSGERLETKLSSTYYSPARRSRKLRPSCLRIPEKTTHLAGMLTPCRDMRYQLRSLCRHKLAEADHGKGLGREEDFDESSSEEKLDDLCRGRSAEARKRSRSNPKLERGSHLLDDGEQAAVVDSNASAEQVPHVGDLREELVGS